MIGTLNETQINNILVSQVIARLACTDGKQPYIIPVTYIFDGTYLIGQLREGKKISILRKNPNVCLQVDLINNMANWQSVIVDGTFQELKGKEAEKLRQYLYDHIFPFKTSSTVHAHEHENSGEIKAEKPGKPVMYRIKIKSKTGRFEKQ